jgi:hypothetical protein
MEFVLQLASLLGQLIILGAIAWVIDKIVNL